MEWIICFSIGIIIGTILGYILYSWIYPELPSDNNDWAEDFNPRM